MRIIEDVKLDFKDVLIVPKRSILGSRSEVDLNREFYFRNSRQKWSGVPILSTNMDTIGTFEMYEKLSKYGMITCLHKYYKSGDFPEDMDKERYMISTGIHDRDWKNLNDIVKTVDPKFVCIDVANGYSVKFFDYVRRVREAYPDLVLVGGNIVTGEMVEELVINGGLDIVKCGIGSGSVCTTRLQTGIGYPQLSTVIECSDSAHGINAHIISDGGIQYSGDIAKAIGGGADFVMLGSMLSGHDECDGELEEEDNKLYKTFYGMSSEKAMDKYSGGMAKYRSSEGKVVRVLYKGSVEDTIQTILGGLRSTLTYVGAEKLKYLSKCTTFIKVNRQVNEFYK